MRCKERSGDSEEGKVLMKIHRAQAEVMSGPKTGIDYVFALYFSCNLAELQLHVTGA